MRKSTIDKVSLLGDFRLHTTNDEDVVIKGKKNAALLASILLEPAKRINRGDAEALLWSQRSPDQAKASLRQCLSELREQLGSFSNVELITNRLDISLALDAIKLDVEEIIGVAASDNVSEKIRFADHCEGEFLKGLKILDPAFEDWVYSRRLHYSDIYQGILTDLLNELDPTLAEPEDFPVYSPGVDCRKFRIQFHRTLKQFLGALKSLRCHFGNRGHGTNHAIIGAVFIRSEADDAFDFFLTQFNVQLANDLGNRIFERFGVIEIDIKVLVPTDGRFSIVNNID